MSRLENLGAYANPYDIILDLTLGSVLDTVELSAGRMSHDDYIRSLDSRSTSLKKYLDILTKINASDSNVCFEECYVNQESNEVVVKKLVSKLKDALFSGELGYEMYFSEAFENILYTTERVKRHEELRSLILNESKTAFAEDCAFIEEFCKSASIKELRDLDEFNKWSNTHELSNKDIDYILSYISVLLN